MRLIVDGINGRMAMGKIINRIRDREGKAATKRWHLDWQESVRPRKTDLVEISFGVVIMAAVMFLSAYSAQ